MSKCAFYNCRKEHGGSKQFTDIVITVYLCTYHLIGVAEMNSYQDGMKFIKLLKESKNAI